MLPVIIPAFRAKEQLAKCIRHLKKQTMPVEVFIRDNSEDNIYFTAAVNEGIRHFLSADPAYMILLNQDMYLDETAVYEMATFMDRHPACGIVQPLQIHPMRPEFTVCAGGVEAFPFGKHHYGLVSEFAEAEIAWANGACMMLRTRMVKEIGLLDENMSFIGSDSDYCFTARSRGWQVWRCIDARGIHEQGASSHIVDDVIERIKIENMLYFAEKWLTGAVYRNLSEEGENLSVEAVTEWTNRFQEGIRHLSK